MIRTQHCCNIARLSDGAALDWYTVRIVLIHEQLYITQSMYSLHLFREQNSIYQEACVYA
jgi:hypothetical protein